MAPFHESQFHPLLTQNRIKFGIKFHTFVSYDLLCLEKTDQTDLRILRELQKDSSLSQRELADRVGLSQNACWRGCAR